MKEIALSIPLEDISRTLFHQKSKIGEVVEYVRPLRMDSGNLTSIVRFKFSKVGRDPRSLLGLDGVSNVEVLARREDGTYTCIVTTKPSGEMAGLLEGFGKIIFVKETPKLREGLLRVTLLGKEEALREFSAILDRYGIRFTVDRIKGIDSGIADPLDVLTPRQREVLTLAHEFGYFRQPRGISSEKLSRILDLDKSTLIEHLRKAERRLLDSLLAKRP